MIDQMSVEPRASGAGTASAVAVVAGGIVAVIASFLTWTSVSVQTGASPSLGGLFGGLGGAGRAGQGARAGRLREILGRAILSRLGSRSQSGFRTPDGRLVLALGVALIVIGLLSLATRWALLRAGTGGIAAAAGAVVCVLGFAAIAQTTGGGDSLILQQLPISVSAGAGVYVALVGGVASLIAGIVGFLNTGPTIGSAWPSRPATVGPPPTATAPIPTSGAAEPTEPVARPDVD